MNILKITSKIVTVSTKCYIGFFTNSFTIEQKFSSAEGHTFAEVTVDKGTIFVDWD